MKPLACFLNLSLNRVSEAPKYLLHSLLASLETFASYTTLGAKHLFPKEWNECSCRNLRAAYLRRFDISFTLNDDREVQWFEHSVSHFWVWLSTEGVKNVSRPSSLQGWARYTTHTTQIYIYTYKGIYVSIYIHIGIYM